MACITPPAITNPFIYNEVINNLQTDVSALSWLDDVFPVADPGEYDFGNGDRRIVPMVFAQDGTKNYIHLYPDGDRRGGCFFELENGRQEFDLVNEETTITLNAVFYANLERVANRTYDFTDELAASALKAIATGYYSSDITNISVIKDKRQVYDKYGYSYEQLKQHSYPYTAFKIQFTMTIDFSMDCMNPGGFDASYSSPCV